MTNWLQANPFGGESQGIACCSCGDPNAHVVARRSTADGKHVLLWNDGTLTWALGYAIKGSPHPRTREQQQEALRAGWLVLGEVSLYDADEVSELISAARWVAKRSGLPGDVRARLRQKSVSRSGPRPTWTVLQADRDGRPTVRVWRLPRIQYPGLAIWHERGRYEIVRELQGSGTYTGTGMRASTLREVLTMLPEPAL